MGKKKQPTEKILLTVSSLERKKSKQSKNVSRKKLSNGDGVSYGVNRNHHRFYTKNIIIKSEEQLRKEISKFEKSLKGKTGTIKAQYFNGKVDTKTGKLIKGEIGNVCANIVYKKKKLKNGKQTVKPQFKQLKYSKQRKELSQYAEHIFMMLDDFAKEYGIKLPSEADIEFSSTINKLNKLDKVEKEFNKIHPRNKKGQFIKRRKQK
jgi:hypothetical protein